MLIAVKNMVCPRCVTAIQNILKRLDIAFQDVSLGAIRTSADIEADMLEMLRKDMQEIGFDIILHPKEHTVENIKTQLIQWLENNENHTDKLSTFLSNSLNSNYQSLSAAFSEMEQTTIEKYFIQLKIEKAKELLSYNELSLKEIAYKLNYSSTAHLSQQFKSVTGLSPTLFRSQEQKHRKSLDKI